MQVNFKQEVFLLHDSGERYVNRIIVFATKRKLECLGRPGAWFRNGTFKVVPSLFYQLYTVYDLCNGIVVPLVCGILPNKTEETYRRYVTINCYLNTAVQIRSDLSVVEIVFILPCYLTRFFSVVIDNVGPCDVQILYTDFQIAAINAARGVIADIRIQWCFFHLAQSFYRKMCALGFQKR
ncbi:hypothetical protein HPB48_017416 [Haemaphysalis longicornis]|uniref:MULE transposase domain-containing protein n=1 Tax=Haemaphysalis longicornis TaxID=44386 RepID=A0A9J6GIX5_HAELO|nr:hypothetical protein HPB48_017416 [Haemaphysalis longicornis]